MHILLIGSGGREHALAIALSQSPLSPRLSIAPGNPGTEKLGTNITLNPADHAAVIDFCCTEHVDLVVIGPEAPLVAGLVDDLTAAGIKAFGPTRAAARLEGSKGFTKDLCKAANIPTAAYARFSNLGLAQAYLLKVGAPIVIKADGLMAGKGVVVAETLQEAQAALNELFAAGSGVGVVIEEKLVGEEVSFFCICDGVTALPIGSAQDHKRAYDGDLGPNTGGMGAYSPAPVFTAELEARAMKEIILPTMQEMAQRGTPFKGILFAGLILTQKGPQLIEYNCRLGDPETQVVLPRLENDLLSLLFDAVEGRLNTRKIAQKSEHGLVVVMAAQGYPGAYNKGTMIHGLEAFAQPRSDHAEVLHAGTGRIGHAVYAQGGRVLNIRAKGVSLREAHDRAYQALADIDWPEGFYRKDIGGKAL